MTKYYAVTCKCGHVGKHTYMPITFPIKASDGKEAARVARAFPRVKHDKKDAILDVREIDYEEYCLLEEMNRNDPYLQCKSIQEQRMYDFSDRVVYEEYKDYRLDKYEINHEVYVGKERIKSPKKYSRLSSYLMSNNEWNNTKTTCYAY